MNKVFTIVLLNEIIRNLSNKRIEGIPLRKSHKSDEGFKHRKM